MTSLYDHKGQSSFLAPGTNCWRIETAERVKLLVDAAAYFANLRQVMAAARDTIFIIGWDIDSRVRLYPEDGDDGLPLPLGEYLDTLASRHGALRIYVLNWDFAMLYALDREFLPIYNLGWRTHRRLHFHMDDSHPAGGSHHQKIVVVDDTIAFVGGIDLTSGRWDTPAHDAANPRRKNPNGETYPPFHDVQLMIAGAAAAAIGELSRERWRRATGRSPTVTRRSSRGDLWPPDLLPDFESARVAIARTEPAYDGREPVEEIRQLYLDCIAQAKKSIYIENQYFTSAVVAEAITRRLAEPDGPEIVVVSRLKGSGWLEHNTMYVLRSRLMQKLERVVGAERLRFYYPHQAGLGKDCIDLHTKLIVVDDRVLRVGSANLNNRSFGIDTECDVLIEAANERERNSIAGIRNSLLAEHLGVSAQDVAEAVERQGSLIRAIDSLRGNTRTLEPTPSHIDREIDALVPDSAVIDPEQPIDPDTLVDELVQREERPKAGMRIVAVVGVLLLFSMLAAAWRWGPLTEWLRPSTLHALAETARHAPGTPVWIMLAYVVASLLAVPITLVVVATAFTFGPWVGVGYAIAGAVAGAAVTFGLGRMLGRRTVRRLAGRRLNALSRRLGKGGLTAVLLFRVVPVAPFTLLNLVAGASHLRLWDFVLGTALGMAPGVIVICVFTDRVAAVLNDPSPEQITWLLVVLFFLVLAGVGTHRWLTRRARARGDSADAE